jgi:hypothetical protein
MPRGLEAMGWKSADDGEDQYNVFDDSDDEPGDVTINEVRNVAVRSGGSTTAIGHATGPIHTGCGDVYVVYGD